MYLHADQLPERAVLRGFDLCIVGAGAAGIAMAHRLANSSLKVILLVSGSPDDKTLPDEDRQSLYHGTAGDFSAESRSGFLASLAPEYVWRYNQPLRISGRVRLIRSTSCRVPVSAMSPGLSLWTS